MQISCPFCNNEDISIVFKSKDHLVTGEEFNIVDCPNCSLRFTHPVPEKQFISKYYESEDYHSHMAAGKSILTKIYSLVRNIALKNKAGLVEKHANTQSGRILDVGCGTGEFLRKMKNRNWEVTGMDASKVARDFALNKYGIDVLPPESIDKLQMEQFDAITMWHSLEHVHEPQQYLTAISRAIIEDGLLVIAIPNFNSLDGHYYQSDWAGYDVPRHLYHFNRDTIISLVIRHGFVFQELKAMPFDPFYVSILSEKHRGGSLINAMITGTRSWISALFRPDHSSSVIYIFKKNRTNKRF